MRADFAEAVLAVAALVPPGRVLSYGDIAELLGTGGPRQVGFVLAGSGGAAPWWRIIRQDGSLPAFLAEAAAGHYRQEGTALAADGLRVNMRTARWQPGEAELVLIEKIAFRLSAPPGVLPEMSDPDDAL